MTPGVQFPAAYTSWLPSGPSWVPGVLKSPSTAHTLQPLAACWASPVPVCGDLGAADRDGGQEPSPV